MKTIDHQPLEHPFLKGMSRPHLDILALCAMRVELHPGDLLVREGDPANRFYLIESGEVALEAEACNGGPILVQTAGAGDVVGWSWLFPPYTLHFSARVTKPVKAAFFYATWLREQCEEDPALGYELAKRVAGVLMHRLEAMTNQCFLAGRTA